MSNPYTVQLLNDLHNHFPELLYNHQRFQTGADIVGYVNNIVRLTPMHGAYHYYQQQYHAYYHPEHARGVIDDLYMPPPAPPASYPPSPTYPPVAASPIMAPAAPSLQDLIGAAEDDDDLSQLYGGRAPSNPNLRIPILPLLPSVQVRSGRAAGGAAAPAAASLAAPPPAAPAAAAPSSARSSARIMRFSQIIPLSDVSVEAIFNQLMQDALPANLHELLEDVPVIPTEEHLRNNTSVARLAEDFDDNCAICQDPLLINQDARTINHCNHMFHKQCIETWFRRHIHCPCCRQDVREP